MWRAECFSNHDYLYETTRTCSPGSHPDNSLGVREKGNLSPGDITVVQGVRKHADRLYLVLVRILEAAVSGAAPKFLQNVEHEHTLSKHEEFLNACRWPGWNNDSRIYRAPWQMRQASASLGEVGCVATNESERAGHPNYRKLTHPLFRFGV